MALPHPPMVAMLLLLLLLLSTTGRATSGGSCHLSPIFGPNADGTGQAGTCADLRPKWLEGNGSFWDYGFRIGSTWTTSEPSSNGKDQSKCRDLPAEALAVMGKTGDFMVTWLACTKGTGWKYLRVFDLPGFPTPGPVVKVTTAVYDVVTKFPTYDEWVQGRVFCLSPGFKVKSFHYFKP